MEPMIDINRASTKQLTQLPGIAKNIAYRIVNHRVRHGYFTHWEELAEVKDFPMHALEEIKQRATLKIPSENREAVGPRRIKLSHIQRETRKPKGYTRRLRATRKSDQAKRAA